MLITDITSEDIEGLDLKDKEFEVFFRRLLEAEHELRHRKDAKIKGPAAAYHGDDKRDLVFEAQGPPKVPREDFFTALTWDELRPIWYSCKGGKGWKESIKKDFRRADVNTLKAGKDFEPRPPKSLIRHLGRGHRLAFVISRRTIDNANFLDDIAELLEFWLRHEDLTIPQDLRSQLEVIDANDLAYFIRRHRPANLPPRVRQKLNLNLPAGFMRWDQWTDELGGRDIVNFEEDSARSAILEAIGNHDTAVIRVFGPPGTGKTRVVYEGIERLDDDARARTFYCRDLDFGDEMGSWLRSAGGSWLVLDEMRTLDVDQIVPMFEAHGQPGARLFLVGTSDERTQSEPGRAFDLRGLGDEAIDRVIEHELRRAPSAEELRLVHELSENYPWYAVLLTRALADDPLSIAEGVDDGVRWDYGAQRVLAGSRRDFSSDDVWRREAELRAKCLLVAMMTRDLELPWDEIWERHGAGLAEAIDEPLQWHEVKKREKVCRDRQLLRQSGRRAQRRYVSPNNLARIIVDHFFTDPDLGPKVRRYAPEFRESLLAIAKSVHVKPSVVEGLALGEWAELIRRAEQGDMEAVGEYLGVRAASHHAAVEQPEAAAMAVAHVVLGFDIPRLAEAKSVRSALRGVLEHVIHRAISSTAFVSAEAALLRLAQLEDEPWSNNASGLWKSIFLAGLDQTHQPWELRLARLDERLHDNDPERRGLAIDAVADAVDIRVPGLGYQEDDTRDGPWPTPSEDDLLERWNQLWARLLRATSDQDSSLASRARKTVAEKLRSGLRRGLGLDGAELQQLATGVETWSAEQRQDLADSIADVRRYDYAEISEFEELTKGIQMLEDALAPVDLRERIVAWVGSWHPGPWNINDKDRSLRERGTDRDLARALLSSADDHDWALSWLQGQHAHRSRAFITALGFVDETRTMRPSIVERVREGGDPRMLTSYLLGQAEREGPDGLETWVDENAHESALVPAFIGFTVWQTPSATRLRRLRRWLTHGTSAKDLDLLGHRGWTEHLDPAELLEFIVELNAREEAAPTALLLATKLSERELSVPQRERLFDSLPLILRTCLKERVVAATQPWFTSGVLVLVSAERFSEIVELLVLALDVSVEHPNVGLGHRLLQKLLQEGVAEQLWPYLGSALLEHPTGILPLQFSKDNLLAYLEPETVLGWIGSDLFRGRLIAELASPHGERLGEVVRQLLVRFGHESEVARELEARARSTPRAVMGGMHVFWREQQRHAENWAKDQHPVVRRWARELEASFRQRIEEDEAQRAFRLRYG